VDAAAGRVNVEPVLPLDYGRPPPPPAWDPGAGALVRLGFAIGLAFLCGGFAYALSTPRTEGGAGFASVGGLLIGLTIPLRFGATRAGRS
jgi:hypothetical protein